jgi:2-polyprenyl-6-methoxyphenol hydroxylase-like FAD-dependent oxidoreductase
MGDLVVCGGSVIGLATAVMLARDGHRVTVLEADPDGAPEVPAQAWESWRRPGVAQLRQPHILMARFRQVCDEELPDVTDLLLAAGCTWVDYMASRPPALAADPAREGDAALRCLTGRRPVVEAVFAELAANEPGVTVRRGVRVAELVAGPSAIAGVPHVAGVVTTTGETLSADLVVDAMGRRTPSSGWLTDLGARTPLQESQDHGFAYYTRFFTGPVRPQLRGRTIVPLGSMSVLTLAGDNGTWSVTVYVGSGDPPLKAMRDPAVFTRVIAACPLQAHWLDGTPISDVLPMAGILDRHRGLVVDGTPVATGFVAVGDAWACTNPSAGRGLSVGAVHAQQLRQAVRELLDQPTELACSFDERTERVVGPFYRNQVAFDRFRTAEMAAAREGAQAPPSHPQMSALETAAGSDPDAYRGLIETVLCLALPEDVLARPAVRAAMERHGRDPARPTPGPDRAELLRLVSV